ncbi:protein Wnt [Nephila pilipes]|uniref:Protein Wnt n=1 Tax=Nephila pilipes TaxID=299642 RepID=A0A8X6NZ00_NEPPI|nr:protein Wnt [Nephila pilipes]
MHRGVSLLATPDECYCEGGEVGGEDLCGPGRHDTFRTFLKYLGMVGVSVTPPDMASEQVSLCSAVPGLVVQQQRVCHAHPAVIRAVSGGARRGIEECQNQFRHDRWNCTVEGGESVFDHTLQREFWVSRTDKLFESILSCYLVVEDILLKEVVEVLEKEAVDRRDMSVVVYDSTFVPPNNNHNLLLIQLRFGEVFWCSLSTVAEQRAPNLCLATVFNAVGCL